MKTKSKTIIELKKRNLTPLVSLKCLFYKGRCFSTRSVSTASRRYSCSLVDWMVQKHKTLRAATRQDWMHCGHPVFCLGSACLRRRLLICYSWKPYRKGYRRDFITTVANTCICDAISWIQIEFSRLHGNAGLEKNDYIQNDGRQTNGTWRKGGTKKDWENCTHLWRNFGYASDLKCSIKTVSSYTL